MKLKNRLPIVEFTGELLTYKQVRAAFGWKENGTIRRYVAMNLLTRVRVGTRSADMRITVTSAKSLREHLRRIDDDEAYAVKARMQTLREKKGMQQPTSDEILLDADEIIKQSRIQRILPDASPEVGSTYTAPQQPARSQNLGFSSRRGI